MKRLFFFMMISFLFVASAAAGGVENFRAHLSGGEEVPPVETLAQGQAVFQLNPAGDELSFKLIVANIEGATQAHIHLGPPGQNGLIVAFLFGFVPGGVTTNGVLAEGTLIEEDLVGPLGGAPLSDLIKALETGNAYVNVHTIANPGGEIRGQVR